MLCAVTKHKLENGQSFTETLNHKTVKLLLLKTECSVVYEKVAVNDKIFCGFLIELYHGLLSLYIASHLKGKLSTDQDVVMVIQLAIIRYFEQKIDEGWAFESNNKFKNFPDILFKQSETSLAEILQFFLPEIKWKAKTFINPSSKIGRRFSKEEMTQMTKNIFSVGFQNEEFYRSLTEVIFLKLTQDFKMLGIICKPTPFGNQKDKLDDNCFRGKTASAYYF